MTRTKKARLVLAGTGAALAIAAPVAQACYSRTSPSAPAPVDVCKLDVDALLAKYGANLTAAQKQFILDAAKQMMAAKGCTTVVVDPGNGGNNS